METKGTLPNSVGRLAAARQLTELARALTDVGAATASGLWGSGVAAVTASVEGQLNRPLVLICGHIDEADDLADDMELFHGRRPEVMPTLEMAGNLGRVSEEQVVNRLQLIARLSRGETGADGKPFLMVAPIQAVMQQVPSRNQLSELMWSLKPGMKLEPEKLIVWLSEHGYNRLEQVEVPGDFAVRGGIVDIYLPGEHPESKDVIGLAVRVDFFDDEIESIKTFSLDTLGSGDVMPRVQVMDLKGKLDTSASVSIFAHLPPETVVVLWEPLEIAEQSRSYLDRLPEVQGVYPLSAVLKNAERFTRLELSQFDQGASAVRSLVGHSVPNFRLPVRSLQRFETDVKKAMGELAELADKEDVTVFCENQGEAQRFGELLEQERPGLSAKVATHIGYLHRGFVWDEQLVDESTGKAVRSGNRPIALVGHHELFHRYEMRRRVQKVTASRPVDSFLDLKVGDYVVHVAHGIAKFTGMQTITKDGKADEYLTLRFAENAALHVPAARINLIQKYVGGLHGHPPLSRLGSGLWEKQKEKVAEAVMDMAAELIEVQAARAAEQGYAYPPDTEWQREFEAEFPYEPTVDQLTSAEEIKQDMQNRRPMDRLLCGDVGYGKTEMAMRAAFKAVEAGKQVAVLVPTTVLAEQHFRSFRERMASYPFAIESISRFRTAREQKEIIKRTKEGDVDVLIGTHRLISKDVNFKDLGLVVIDEEQRFGVTHKERLKQMRKMVDVLTMSATPIPRTLHMSMLGLRDISSLTTAPQDRRSVVTEVMAFDKERVKQAILRELNREGQVYFVHNRVHNIGDIAEMIQQMVPDARVIIGHGQMEEGEMEDAMVKFIRHDADILVATTIIESGLDIPNANTIIINNADRFGLSELHQLRGRVGRWKHRAYCYLLLPADRPVTPVAAKRLKAIEEYSHLGAGFKIAMRDLEIRGAGNILGPEQSGHIATVGYEMYCQLLEEATRQLKNEPKPIVPEAHVDIGISAFIPKTYIPADRQRMDLYRRLTRCTGIEMLGQLEQDMKDAFGEPPHPAVLLIALTEMRLLAGHFGIESVIKKDPDVILTVRDATRSGFALTGAPGTQRVIDEKTVYLRMPAVYTQPDTLLVVMRNLLKQAYERERKGEKIEVKAVQAAVAAKNVREERPALKSSGVRVNLPIPDRGEKKVEQKPKLSAQQEGQLQKLEALRGILTEEEYQAAKKRISGG
jgi:transcription-repair coupling factor (superfamily II helicase)